MGALTGSGAARRAAEAQARALEEQTRNAQSAASEAARQSAIQTQQVQQREAATREVESMQQADATAAKAPDVNTGAESASDSTTRKRARFNTSGSLPSVSI